LAVADIFGKGYDVLAEAIKFLPEGVELHIAGQGTDAQPIRQLFARDNVSLYGYLDKVGVRDLLWKSDALVLPSRSEAQPLVLLEALATGIPAVTTESIPPSVRIPEACRFAPIGDAQKLAEKMREVMNIRPSRQFADIVRHQASPSVIASKLTEIFSDVSLAR
jgi:glycosyltransferase involved in cell wall biosynthesis